MKVSGGGLPELAAAVEAEHRGAASSTPAPASKVIVANAGPPKPSWMKDADLGAAEAADAEKLAAWQAHFQAPPASLSDYKIRPPLPGQPPLSGEQIVALRTVANAIGAGPGEFWNLQEILDKPEPEVPYPVWMKQADAMDAELTQRYGEPRAKEMATHAVAAIDAAEALRLDPRAIEAWRRKITVNRPALELSAEVGRRLAKRKPA